MDLDSPIRRYWPELRVDATLRQAPSHQAGVPIVDDVVPGSILDWDLMAKAVARQEAKKLRTGKRGLRPTRRAGLVKMAPQVGDAGSGGDEHGATGFAGAAAIAAAVIGLVAGCADEASDVSDSGAPDPRLVDLIVALDPAVSALESERAASGVEVVSIDASGLTDVDLGEARTQTDEALFELEEAADKAGDSGTAYGSAFDALDRLPQVRVDVDARSGSIDISDTQALWAVEAPYAEMTTAILDAAKGTAQHIDDPQLRRGAALHAASVGQLVQEQELMRSSWSRLSGMV